MIEDINKAWEMAKAEKKYRETSDDRFDSFAFPVQGEDKVRFEERANKMAEQAGEEYDRKLEEEKNAAINTITAEQQTEANTIFPEEENIENFKIENLTENTRRLARIFQEREQDRMSALIEPDAISRLKGTCIALEEAKQKNDIEGVKNSLRRLTQTFAEVGRVSSRGPVRDDTENLSKVIRGIKALHDQVFDMKSDKLGEELNQIINKLLSVTEGSWQLLAKKREVLKRYEEGRHY